MAFADPQSITISGTANSLPRTGSGDNSGSFTKDDGNLKVSVDHSYAKRTSRRLKLDVRKVGPDPIYPSQNTISTMSISIVVNVPPVGFTPAEVKAQWDGLLANLAANSAANTVKFFGGES